MKYYITAKVPEPQQSLVSAIREHTMWLAKDENYYYWTYLPSTRTRFSSYVEAYVVLQSLQAGSLLDLQILQGSI